MNRENFQDMGIMKLHKESFVFETSSLSSFTSLCNFLIFSSNPSPAILNSQ